MNIIDNQLLTWGIFALATVVRTVFTSALSLAHTACTNILTQSHCDINVGPLPGNSIGNVNLDHTGAPGHTRKSIVAIMVDN
jgi:hypothetical protein